MALYDHYLGPNAVDNTASKAEKALANSSYRNEQRRWNFEKYATQQKRQHIILENLVQHGYKGIDERTKVRYLLDGIKTDSLDTVKTQILSNQEYRNSFDKCVTLFSDFIKQTTGDVAPTRTISQVTVKVKGGNELQLPSNPEDISD